MHVAIESTFLSLIAEENYWLAHTESHGRLGIFAITLSLACAVHEDFCRFDHQAFQQAFVFMSFGGTQSRIEISQLEFLESLIEKDFVACIRHVPEILSASHAG